MDTARHARVKEVFLAVVALPPEERVVALDEACRDDPSLRDEVQSLLFHHSDDSLLETRGGDDAAPVELPGGEISEPLFLGQQVGNFRVVKKLGQGGMGTVYEAMHRYIERKAAIKVMHAHLSQNPQFTSRFLNEARAVNLIQHPGLVEVFEFGLLDTGTAYTVMEFLEGEPLIERLRRATAAGAGLGDEALEIAHQIALAMAAVHEKKIVHRDLKPDNIMVLPDAERPFGLRTKVLDFGAAKLARPQDGLKTESGAIIGTPAYMSPEQCTGKPLIDGKADVYALGIMLYQMLTGVLPFAARLSFDYLAAHAREEPRPLRELLPSVPDALLELLRSMLAKQPEQRPTMNEVAIKLEQLLSAPSLAWSLTVRPVAADSQHVQTRSTIPRRRPPMLIAASLLLMLGAITVAALWQRPQPRVATKITPRLEPVVAPPRTVRWEVTSTPAGADVISTDDKVLGSTPWSVERPQTSGETTLTLRHPGYAERRIILSNNTSANHEINLAPLVDKPPPPPQTPSLPSTTEPRDKSARPIKKPRPASKPDDVEVKLLMD